MSVYEKILINKNLFKSVNEDHFYKNDEKKFSNLCKRILPKYINNNLDVEIFKFEFCLTPRENMATEPDLFIIDKNYSYFSVVEVELSHHSLNRHVIPQMTSIVLYDYENHAEEVFEYLKRKNKPNFRYKKEKFCNMLKILTPEFITISDTFDEGWDTQLKKLGVRYIGLTEFADDNRDTSYYFKDSIPPKPFSELKVLWNGSFFICTVKENKVLKNGHTYELGYKNEIYEFKVYRRSQKDVFLTHPLGSKKLLEIENDKIYKLNFKNGILNIEEE